MSSEPSQIIEFLISGKWGIRKMKLAVGWGVLFGLVWFEICLVE